MPNYRTIASLLAASGVALSSTAATAQDVILSEVHADGGWIELHNRGTAPTDLSNWSIYLATDTPGRPNTYWWGFAGGTTIAAGDYLQIHWMAPRQPNTQHEIYTGDTSFWFLFGLGAEPLPAQRGALALLSSRDSSQMNNAGVFVDWVTWGSGGLTREDLAAQAGVWVQGHATPPISPGASLARDATLSLPATPELMWFRDSTPSPLQQNSTPASVTPIGLPCAPMGHHLLGAPELRASSSPILGNPDFALAVTNTTGLLFETCAVGFALESSPVGAPSLIPAVPGGPACRQWIDPATMLGSFWFPTRPTRTAVPFGLRHLPPTLAGARFHVQAIVFEHRAQAWPPYQGVTNGLTIELGM